jgi:hypothetical protein
MSTRRRSAIRRGWLAAGLMMTCLAAAGAEEKAKDAAAETEQQARLRDELKSPPAAIVYESYRGGNWELCSIRLDGGGAVNLTKTPDVHELYPHASPDGRRICFVADEGEGGAKIRSVYYMNADGGGRTLVARNARQPCWGPDGRRIAYLKGEFDRYTTKDFATKGVFIYDLETHRHREHVNGELHHLYNLCWSPDGKWFTATVHGGMGHKHANLIFPADGTDVFALTGVGGCRPDIRADGKMLTWNAGDQLISVADLDLSAQPPKVTHARKAITCDKEHEVYHADWSPCGRYIAFSHGPKGAEQVGLVAKDWHICVADAAKPDVWVVLTTDGQSNKEPDWLPAASGKAKHQTPPAP